MRRSVLPSVLLAVGSWTVAAVDAQGVDLVVVPSGGFTMGLTDSQREHLQGAGWPEGHFVDETPSHEVVLPDFWIMREKVSNAEFVAYLNGLDSPRTSGAGGRYSWIGVPDPSIQFDARRQVHLTADGHGTDPVKQATWVGATGYCGSLGMRLPTEAEWEKAARGQDARLYPWGDNIDQTRANYGTQMTLALILFRQTSPDELLDVHESDWLDDSDGYLRVSPTDAFPLGGSPYGVLDMVGNVAEWTADWYSADYYGVSPATNPMGPITGDFRVVRGCSYLCGQDELRVTNRSWQDPTKDLGIDQIGFRCVSETEVPTGVSGKTWGEIKAGRSQR